MTTTPSIPAEVAPHMADPDATEAQAPVEQAAPASAKTSTVRRRLRDQAAENPLLTLFGTLFGVLLTLFGTVIIALLVFGLGTINSRFDDVHARIDDTNDRIDRLEDAMLAGFAAQDAKIDELDAKFDEMNLKLTALIAALNATEAVDAALEGRLVAPGADGSDPPTDVEPPES